MEKEELLTEALNQIFSKPLSITIIGIIIIFSILVYKNNFTCESGKQIVLLISISFYGMTLFNTTYFMWLQRMKKIYGIKKNENITTFIAILIAIVVTMIIKYYPC